MRGEIKKPFWRSAESLAFVDLTVLQSVVDADVQLSILRLVKV